MHRPRVRCFTSVNDQSIATLSTAAAAAADDDDDAVCVSLTLVENLQTRASYNAPLLSYTAYRNGPKK